MMLEASLRLGSCLTAVLSIVEAVATVGKPEGFGSKASGGVAGPTVTPSSTLELTRYLVQEGPLNIVVEKTFDFRELQGIAWEYGCAPYGVAFVCQLAINKREWCQIVNPAAPMVAVEYQKASLYPLVVSSDKSVLGVNKNGIIRGKGFLIPNGTNNVILQNLEIKNLNARYKWGGDAIALEGTSNIWIDHIKVWQCLEPPEVLGVTECLTFPTDLFNWRPSYRYEEGHERRRHDIQQLHRRTNQLVSPL